VIGFRDYIEFAERHLEIAEKELDNGKNADLYLIPCVILAWSAIESFVNNRLDEFDSLPPALFALHEKAFLTEQQLTFENQGGKAGQFLIKGTLYRKLSDKILFLIAKCGSVVKKGESPWQEFEALKEVRDSLAHPRQAKHAGITPDLARTCIKTSKAVILFISEGLGFRIEF
jgi:hypothetical protein